MNWNYITGFFDADGSITAVACSKGRNKTIQISFSNNELNILKNIKDFIQKDIDVMGNISKKIALKETHQDSYELKYTYQKALLVANKLESKHPKKIHRIKMYNLIQQKTKRNGKYSKEELIERENLLLQFFKH